MTYKTLSQLFYILALLFTVAAIIVAVVMFLSAAMPVIILILLSFGAFRAKSYFDKKADEPKVTVLDQE